MKEVLAIGSEISEPPLVTSYQALLQNNDFHSHLKTESIVQEIDLPMIDLCNLQSENREKRRLCAEEIVKAASEWGFFQVLNHGISLELLEEIKREQVKLFRLPFEKKVSSGILNDSYRWGNPAALSVDQFSWSEAFHVPLDKISDEDCSHGEFSSLRESMKNLGMAMSNLGRALADVLVQNLGYSCGNFPKNCDEKTCFLRLNRYPPCPFSRPETGAACGLVSHTDSDYLTILYQDHVGGLQVMKDSRWVAVRPNRNALIVNIGDLFQAWSNDAYKSVEHRVITNAKRERYSIAYFVCPSYDSTIGANAQPSRYRSFTFGEYRKQVQDDVKRTGKKFGLSRFQV
ncbi:2-oxoglutarate (2OG) and Fe(II)-dependent oxygenase superfamily protein [Rhynchospora pubera]|uniref:2-oxoglutarate (2OG) and Fe(II)-dependent oxygenase superfamily protein n=1 Tax=Rhynchospora pubera TaxID=906938 RepID=A0AAV8BUY7_9POAL|nr:2-oxoglutarate (2OG) and Fe(II)-dependent oxygenase superfamily protein [Rhynchospora pubera]